MAAEMLAPKWFDKDPALSNEDNFDQLRKAVASAVRLYQAAPAPDTAFGLYAAHYPAQIEAGAREGLNPLVAGFGPALVDRAILDALCRIEQVSVFAALRGNLPGIDARLTPDLDGFDLGRFFALRQTPTAIHARHTVGLVDPITDADLAAEDRVGDGLPETLEQVVATYGHSYFKLKVGGNLPADIVRLERIAGVLDRLGDGYHVTIDGNEQYTDIDAVLTLCTAIDASPKLRRLKQSVLFIEQPIARAQAMQSSIALLAAMRPTLIDESDGEIGSFAAARALGYTGVSSKSCKGLYKALLNAARCAHWNDGLQEPKFFMSAEDLTTQAGLAVQQDLALAALVGCGHVERNGHHYVNGMAAAPADEQEDFLLRHPDLYRQDGRVVRLRIEQGQITLGSLDQPGFACAAEPRWDAMAQQDYGV
jgi:L-alanine-DL-glutamate epimerase-like enolase superfamily enzyme